MKDVFKIKQDRERRRYSKSSNMSSGIDRVHAYMWRARGRDGGRVRRQMYILCENSCVIQSSCGVFTEISPPIDDVYDAMPLQLLCEEISHLTHTHTHTLTHTMTRAGAALIACVTMVPKDPQKGNGQLLSYRLPRRRPRLEVLVLAA